MIRGLKHLRQTIRLDLSAIFWVAAAFAHAQTPPAVTGSDTTVVKQSNIVPPIVAKPCRPGNCLFAGQTVTLLVSGGKTIAGPVQELRSEFEAATGAKLVIVEKAIDEARPAT